MGAQDFHRSVSRYSVIQFEFLQSQINRTVGSEKTTYIQRHFQNDALIYLGY